MLTQGLLDHPVLFDPYSGTVTRDNPVPERAIERRRSLTPASKAADLSGIGRVDWNEVRAHVADWYARGKQSNLAAFVLHFRLTSSVAGDASIRDCFYAGNEKTKKPRKQTGRKGLITGLSLFPHFYPNLLNIVPDAFVDENGVVDVQQLGKESPAFQYYHDLGDEMRSFFNAFDGADPGSVEPQTGIPPADQLNFCSNSSKWCRTTCLVLSGNHPSSTPGVAKKANLTQALLTHPALFVAGLYIGMDQLSQSSAKQGIDVVARLNMLSDIPWYTVCPELLESLADPKRGAARVYWYDYSKIPFWRSADYARLGQGIGLRPGEVLDLTFSFSGVVNNTVACQEALALRRPDLGYENGVRIAMAFAPANPERRATYAGKPEYGVRRTTWTEIVQEGTRTKMVTQRDGQYYVNLPEIGRHVLVDGDGSDYRIDDPGGCIVALNFKNPLITEEFVPGWEARLRDARKYFTAKVPDIEGVPTLDPSVLPRRRNPLAVMQPDQHFSTGDAPEALAAGEIKFPMFQVGGLLIGPHVPTVLED